ncbi:hypothetical protein [uncultured Desulfobacter sp.]|uniref:hypothetical protein n=1 Tax=uncultured Desulfobacter sp. TaxID=240139 RepID=UPI002AABCD7C|nr:hypothetical protein [uncultured Desulfobacter sp.]
MKQNTTRYDTNRKIKQILVSHSTDLTRIFFSFSGKTARFSGRFLKTSGQEMKFEEVDTLCRSLTNLAEIRFLNFDMDDWAISAGLGAMNIVKKSVPSSDASDARKVHKIDTPESVEDVLKDEFGG